MKNLETIIRAALLATLLSACADATGPMGAESRRYETNVGGGTGTAAPAPSGGGTYGSGGNVLPGSTSGAPRLMQSADGGGTYGSGGKATTDTTGGNTVTGVTTSTTQCPPDEERGGGTYGSGGITGCTTEPTP